MRAALELHKEVLQGLQTVDAFSQDMFLPEEIDFHLNKQQDIFVNELLDEGFADRQLRLDYIQDLIVKNKPLPVFISPTAFYYESGAVTSFLPGDYKHLLSTRTGIRATDDCAEIIEKLEEKSKYFSFLELSTTVTVAPYYPRVQLVRILADQSEVIMADTSVGAEEKDDTYLVIKNILYQANKKLIDVEAYWEKYAGSERQGNIKLNTFIITDDDSAIKYKLVIFKDNGDIQNEVVTDPEEQKVEVYPDSVLKPLTKIFYTSTSLLDNKEVYERRQSVFFSPKIQQPHTLLADGVLFNYFGDTFIIEKVLIDYIREPQPISITADQGCELSLSASRIVSNRTIEYLKLAIENPSYKEVLQHNEIRDQK